MKRYLFCLALISMFWVGISITAEPEGEDTSNVVLSSKTVTGPGTVYLYARRLQGPTYTFTNIGGDTLYLNGLPRYPLYKISRFSRLPKEEQIKLLAEAKHEHAADMRRYHKLTVMHEAGASDVELLEYLAGYYRKMPGIIDVTIHGYYGVARYADGGIREFSLPTFEQIPEKTPEDRHAFHEFLIERFRRTIESGGIAAYGVYADSLTYQVEGSKVALQLMEQRQLFAKLASGATLTQDDVRDTPLSNEGFRRDVAKALKNGSIKEEGSQ